MTSIVAAPGVISDAHWRRSVCTGQWMFCEICCQKCSVPCACCAGSMGVLLVVGCYLLIVEIIVLTGCLPGLLLATAPTAASRGELGRELPLHQRAEHDQ